MKKLLHITFLLSLLFTQTFAQTNVFPASGNVGIGTTNPSGIFHINSLNPVIHLTSANPTQPSVAIRGNDNMWVMGWGGLPGHENISIGSQGGIGSRTLTFAVGGFARMKIASNGNIGIGTTTPERSLDILSTDPNPGIRIRSEGKSTSVALQVAEGDYGYLNLGGNTIIRGNGHSSYFDGNVGIGTTTPDAELTVKGMVHAQEVKVDLNGATAPDFVFASDYHLPSLAETEQYVRENSHLPGIPSASEMEKNGFGLKDMNLKLLQKVEELTLHLIDQDKKITQIQAENEQLKALLETN